MRGIAIDGQLCAGKTTIASSVEKALASNGQNVRRFSVDWFLTERDKRNYQADPRMMNLESWFDLEEAEKALNFFLGRNHSDASCAIQAYDRATGERSQVVSITPAQDNAFILIEGLYSLKLLETIERARVLRCYVWSSEQVSFERMLKRNTYIDRERLTFEAQHIYVPSLRTYDAMVRGELGFDTELVTDNFASIMVKATCLS